jgi:hypothetical protein
MEKTAFAAKVGDKVKINQTLRKILQSMKADEKVSTIVHPAYFMN